MNKKDLAKSLSKKTFLTQKESCDIIDEIFNIITEEVNDGSDVSLVGFGKFYAYQHAARPVRNPKTQEETVLKQYKVLKFKISPILKNKMKDI